MLFYCLFGLNKGEIGMCREPWELTSNSLIKYSVSHQFGLMNSDSQEEVRPVVSPPSLSDSMSQQIRVRMRV